MGNSDKRREIVTGLMPITRKSDGSERFFYETGNIEGSSIGDFLIKPCMKLCTHYRRSTGAFGWSALVTWADEIYRIINEGVQIDILTHLDLDQNTIKALSTFQDETAKEDFLIQKQNQILRDAIDFRKNPDKHKRSQSEVLNYLIASGQLNIKFAYLSDYDYSVPESIRAQFHMKYGYFKFDEDITLGFEGGFNETITGHHKSGESAQFMISTRENDLERLEAHIIRTDEMWENGNSKIKVRKVSEETIEHARRISKGKPVVRLPVTEVETSTPDPEPEIKVPEYIDYRTGKWKHQGDAVDAWAGNNYQGILAMATGTGKTITSMIALDHLLKEISPLLVVVSVPSNALLQQWTKEAEEFSIKPLIYKGSNREKKLQDLGLLLKKGKRKLGLVIMTNELLVKNETHELLHSLGVKKLHIGDEVHNLGRTTFKENPPDFFDFHLGLSATPKRQYDEEGTDFIFSYFSGISDNSDPVPIFEFGIDKAIEIGVLCKYDYHVHKVHLNEDEMEEFAELSLQISKKFNYKDQDKRSKQDYNNLLMKRRKILENAQNKLAVLKKLLHKQASQISHTLIFASAKGGFDNDYRHDEKQLNEVNRILDELDIVRHQVTGKESRDKELLAGIIRTFVSKHIKVLTSMVVLDEGVDIPPIRQAFILSSTTIEGTWVQRRGRVLRTSPGKEKAIIHDFLVLPGVSADDSSAKKILESELKRIKEFSSLADNQWSNGGPHQTITEIETILYQ